MAKILVKYMVAITEELDWPDDELEDFTYDNLTINLNPNKAVDYDEIDIISVKKDGVEHTFD